MFMSRLRLLTAIAATALVTACGATTEPVLASGELDITASYQGDSAASILPLGADATPGEGAILIMGHIRTPTPCYDLSSRIDRSGQNVTVTIVARGDVLKLCAQVIAVRSYRLRVGDLAPGSYTVKVIYEYVYDRTERETKLEKVVRVN